MSSAKHTEGRLRPEPQEEYYGNDGDTRPTGMGLVSVSDGDLVVATVNDFYSDGSEGRTNAARLAACWNACEGMEDPESEIAHLRARVLELEKVEADLLATCKDHEAEVVVDEAVELLRNVALLIEESGGVADYHLNGDVAEWPEFEWHAPLFAFLAEHAPLHGPKKPKERYRPGSELEIGAAEAAPRKSVREALEFYADDENWIIQDTGRGGGRRVDERFAVPVREDGGELARQALAALDAEHAPEGRLGSDGR